MFLLWKWMFFKMSQRKSLSFPLFAQQRNILSFVQRLRNGIHRNANMTGYFIGTMCCCGDFSIYWKSNFWFVVQFLPLFSSFAIYPWIHQYESVCWCVYVCIVFNSQVQSISMSLLLLLLLSMSVLCTMLCSRFLFHSSIFHMIPFAFVPFVKWIVFKVH